MGADIESGELAALEFGESGGGDHGGVIGGEAGRREMDRVGHAAVARGGAQSGIAGDPTGNDQGVRPDGFGGRGGAGEEFVDHGMLERSKKV